MFVTAIPPPCGLVQRSPFPRIICLACSCARGDRLIAKATSSDAARLVAEHGFSYVHDVGETAWLAMQPKQCASNPWDETSGSVFEELGDVKQWASGQGAPLANAAFVYPTVLQQQCLACPCPRGDRLVVTPAKSTDETALRGLGFGDLYTP